jgi:Iron-containing redox enzyme
MPLLTSDHCESATWTRHEDQAILQRSLAALNRMRLTPCLDTSGWASELTTEQALRRVEARFIEDERSRVAARARHAPTAADAFVGWFERLRTDGPGQNDELFSWLERDASLEQMTWFLRQEMSGEAGFDDLVALTQVKLPARVKLELARNYWDEMGQGHPGGMHGPMLERLGQGLGIAADGDEVWESLALANLMTGLAANRRYAYQSLGALGVIELTAPGRAVKVNAGLKRLGVSGDARRYFALHATLDLKHSLAWNREVLAPLVAGDPRLASAIAEGALLRLSAGARCFARYRQELGLGEIHAIASIAPS